MGFHCLSSFAEKKVNINRKMLGQTLPEEGPAEARNHNTWGCMRMPRDIETRDTER